MSRCHEQKIWPSEHSPPSIHLARPIVLRAPRRIPAADRSESLHGIRKRQLSHQGTSPPAGYTTATDWAVPKNTRDERVHTPQSGRSFRGAIEQYSDRLVGVSGWNPIGSSPLPSHDTVMIADPFIQGRVTSKTKALVCALTEREGINESTLVKQLLEVVLRTA